VCVCVCVFYMDPLGRWHGLCAMNWDQVARMFDRRCVLTSDCAGLIKSLFSLVFE